MKKAVLDKLDRVVIPKDFCKELNLSPGSPIVVTLERGGVMIRSEQMVCRLCSTTIDFDIKSLSEILGHANTKITLDRYVHPSIERKRLQMNRLSF